MIEVYSLWPQPIAKNRYINHDLFKKKVLDFIEQNKELQVDDVTHPEKMKHFFQGPPPYNELNFFEYIKDDDFEKFLMRSSEIFIRDILGLYLEDGVTITDCWINICGNGAEQRLHQHGNSFISATYYLNYDPEKHAPLKFQNPYNFKSSPFMTLDIETITDYNHSESYCHFIEEGDLILWPSFLSHGYDINNEDERISISMNIVPSTLKTGPYSFQIKK